jgi:hypothetical protein
MPNLTMIITRERPHMVRIQDLTRQNREPFYEIPTVEALHTKLQEVLALSEDELREIFATLERTNFIKAYSVDDDTYERIFG